MRQLSKRVFGPTTFRGALPRRSYEPGEQATAEWGTDEFAAAWVARLAPSAVGDARFVEWAARMMRAAASPATNAAFGRMNSLMDAREVLPLIRVPTLVLDRADARLPKGPVDMPPLEEAQYAADRIPGATFKVLPGRDYLPWVGDQDSIVAEVGRFVTGAAPVREPDRVLLTVLFTDIVDSTKRAAELGDKRWRELLERHNALVRRHIEEYRGREIDRAGDGFLTTFDGPARAIRCAQAIVASAAAGRTRDPRRDSFRRGRASGAGDRRDRSAPRRARGGPG